jgi:ABC-2 type transport system ATP-binding protein
MTSEQALEESCEEVVRVEGVVKDVRPGFGLVKKRILNGVSFSVRRGEVFGFIGPNGAGKTTTLKVLMGLITATEGSATILGHDVSEDEFRQHVGYLPEHPYFYEFLTGRELLSFYAKLSGVPRKKRPARIDELLRWVGLEGAGDQGLRGYSKGMKQRVGIAQALIHDPNVIFLDEPMSGLDPVGRREIRNLILRLRSEGKTVFMNSHILSDVESICDRVAIIAEGEIRYEGSVSEFLGQTENSTDIVLEGVSQEMVTQLAEQCQGTHRQLKGRIEIRVPEKQVPLLLQKVMECDGEIISVNPHRVSLESVFMSTVEG